MGLFDSFPQSNAYSVNLDWIIKKMRELEEYVKNYTAVNNVAYAGIWDITKQYPQWAIVTDRDTSWMSLKPVPVGIPLENAEYWTILADISTLSSTGRDWTKARILFIGDSYGVYSEWPTATKNILGCVGFDYTLSGASFMSGYREMLDKFLTEHPEGAYAITDIIVGGGINDSDQVHVSRLRADISNFVNYAKSKFKNAVISLCYFGYARENSPILNGRNFVYRTVARDIYNDVADLGVVCLTGCENVLHNRALLDADLLHPNKEGGKAIAKALSNALKSGTHRTFYTFKDASDVSLTTGTIGGVLQSAIVDDTAIFRISNFSIAGCEINIANGAYAELCSVTLPNIGYFDDIQITIGGRKNSNMEPFNANVFMHYDGAKLYIRDTNVVESGLYASYTIKTINTINAAFSFPAFAT